MGSQEIDMAMRLLCLALLVAVSAIAVEEASLDGGSDLSAELSVRSDNTGEIDALMRKNSAEGKLQDDVEVDLGSARGHSHHKKPAYAAGYKDGHAAGVRHAGGVSHASKHIVQHAAKKIAKHAAKKVAKKAAKKVVAVKKAAAHHTVKKTLVRHAKHKAHKKVVRPRRRRRRRLPRRRPRRLSRSPGP